MAKLTYEHIYMLPIVIDNEQCFWCFGNVLPVRPFPMIVYVWHVGAIYHNGRGCTWRYDESYNNVPLAPIRRQMSLPGGTENTSSTGSHPETPRATCGVKLGDYLSFFIYQAPIGESGKIGQISLCLSHQVNRGLCVSMTLQIWGTSGAICLLLLVLHHINWPT